MNDYLSSHVLVVALTFFLAGIVKGVAGMGLPTVATSLANCLNEAGRTGSVDRVELGPHVTALVAMLPKDDPAGVRTAA